MAWIANRPRFFSSDAVGDKRLALGLANGTAYYFELSQAGGVGWDEVINDLDGQLRASTLSGGACRLDTGGHVSILADTPFAVLGSDDPRTSAAEWLLPSRLGFPLSTTPYQSTHRAPVTPSGLIALPAIADISPICPTVHTHQAVSQTGALATCLLGFTSRRQFKLDFVPEEDLITLLGMLSEVGDAGWIVLDDGHGTRYTGRLVDSTPIPTRSTPHAPYWSVPITLSLEDA